MCDDQTARTRGTGDPAAVFRRGMTPVGVQRVFRAGHAAVVYQQRAIPRELCKLLTETVGVIEIERCGKPAKNFFVYTCKGLMDQPPTLQDFKATSDETASTTHP